MPTVYIDSDLRRIYEVPDVPHTWVDAGGGLRRYTPDNPGAAPALVQMDLLADIYSPWVRHRDVDDGDYAPIAFDRSGGAIIDVDTQQQAPTELSFRNDRGWRMVLANYEHEVQITGNLRPFDKNVLMFDTTPHTVCGSYPRIESSANLLVRTVETGVSGLTASESADLAQIDTVAALVTQMQGLVDELHKIQGLSAGNPMTVTPALRSAAGINLSISGDGQSSTTVTRSE